MSEEDSVRNGKSEMSILRDSSTNEASTVD